MKKALGIIGVGLIAGVVIYVLWNKTHKTKADAVATPEKEPADNSSDNSISIINHNNLYEETKNRNNKRYYYFDERQDGGIAQRLWIDLDVQILE